MGIYSTSHCRRRCDRFLLNDAIASSIAAPHCSDPAIVHIARSAATNTAFAHGVMHFAHQAATAPAAPQEELHGVKSNSQAARTGSCRSSQSDPPTFILIKPLPLTWRITLEPTHSIRLRALQFILKPHRFAQRRRSSMSEPRPAGRPSSC
jgi:hypothetical protein